jgi:hypothetical protein
VESVTGKWRQKNPALRTANPVAPTVVVPGPITQGLQAPSALRRRGSWSGPSGPLVTKPVAPPAAVGGGSTAPPLRRRGSWSGPSTSTRPEAAAPRWQDDPESWGQFTAKRIPEPEQRVGAELELKSTAIPYAEEQGAPKRFKEWAVKYGHKALFKVKRPSGQKADGPPAELAGTEIHLDQGGTTGLGQASALLELVTSPKSPEDLASTLAALRKGATSKKPDPPPGQPETETGALEDWVGRTFERVHSGTDEDGLNHDEMYEHVLKSIRATPQTGLFPSLAQVTTTHTQEELLRLKNFPTFLKGTAPRGRDGHSSPTLTKLDVQKAYVQGRNAIATHLGQLRPFNQIGSDLPPGFKATGSKGTAVLIKHSAQQLEPAQNGTTGGIPHTTKLTKLPGYQAKGTQPSTGPANLLGGMQTLANKLAPLHERDGSLAYVMEYRGGGPIEHRVGKFMQGGQGAPTPDQLAAEIRQALYPTKKTPDLSGVPESTLKKWRTPQPPPKAKRIVSSKKPTSVLAEPKKPASVLVPPKQRASVLVAPNRRTPVATAPKKPAPVLVAPKEPASALVAPTKRALVSAPPKKPPTAPARKSTGRGQAVKKAD